MPAFCDCSLASEGKTSVRLRNPPACSCANREDGFLQEGERNKQKVNVSYVQMGVKDVKHPLLKQRR